MDTTSTRSEIIVTGSNLDALRAILNLPDVSAVVLVNQADGQIGMSAHHS